MVEKEEFLTKLGEVVSRIDSGKRLLICGDLSVESEVDGFEVCMVVLVLESGMWKLEGEMILEYADALNWAVTNTWFKKEEERLIT